MSVDRRQFLQAMLATSTLGTLAQGAAAQAQSAPQPPLVGAWQIQTYDTEFQDTGDRLPVLGARPRGYLIFTVEGRMATYLEASDRAVPTTDAGRADAFKTLMAYTGRYRIEGDRWVTRVDGAWNVSWTGTEQTRFFTLNGNTLTVVSQWNPNQLFNGRVTRGRLTFVRGE